MIDTLLIANRGEIACRIINTCRQLGIRAIAVYSDADHSARFVHEADEAVHIGASPPSESYLVIEKIMAAARRTNADAIHPGFGFLAENADFARACEAAGILFVGPSPSAIERMGSKSAAKELAIQVGVPTIPGFNTPNASDSLLIDAAHEIGYPLMVKATMGGGGKGMRLVHTAETLPDALTSARREALQAFGSDELMLERALINPRHIEIQVLGDSHGHLIYLGERDCSIQRRHQKILEEAPASGISPELRRAMGEAAVALARAVDYTNAGTVEFLLDQNSSFYFMEMNTRLQVEHPVTEMVTRLDLVEWQIRIAEGASLTIRQDDIKIDGHAIEVRLYAEDPANDFLPVTGEVHLWREPSGEGVRVDSGLKARDQVSIYYDPMLAKIIAHGADRDHARRRLVRALENTVLFGLTSNRAFLLDLLRQSSSDFDALGTATIATFFGDWQQPAGDIPLALIAASVIQASQNGTGYWRNNPNRPMIYRYQSVEGEAEIHLSYTGVKGQFQISLLGQSYDVQVDSLDVNDLTLTVDGHRQTLPFINFSDNSRDNSSDRWWIQTRSSGVRSGVVTLQTISLLPVPKSSADAGGSLRAPMPGSVIAVLVEVGQSVTKGQPLLKLEAMKMEHTITTGADGIVEAIYFQAGDTVEADAQLLRIREV